MPCTSQAWLHKKEHSRSMANARIDRVVVMLPRVYYTHVSFLCGALGARIDCATANHVFCLHSTGFQCLFYTIKITQPVFHIMPRLCVWWWYVFNTKAVWGGWFCLETKLLINNINIEPHKLNQNPITQDYSFIHWRTTKKKLSHREIYWRCTDLLVKSILRRRSLLQLIARLMAFSTIN